MKKENNLSELMRYAGGYRYLTYASLVLAILSGVVSLLPFVYLWRILREVLAVLPNFAEAQDIVFNGWMAVLFSVLAVLLNFAALMCAHLSAFRVAGNLKLRLLEHLAALPTGFTETMGSGRLRKTITESTASTETFLAHQLPDMAAAVATPVMMLVLLFLYDWRLGLISLIPTLLGFLAMFSMAGPAMEKDMRQYQDALEDMNNEAVEYVRGIPVVKTFGQTVFSFHRFKDSIDRYSRFCISYTKRCRTPMLLYELATNSVFAFLIGAALVLTRGGVDETFLLNLLFYILFTPMIATCMNKVMFISENSMIVNDALARIHAILDRQPLAECAGRAEPQDASITLNHVSFRYEGANRDAVHDVSLTVPAGQTVALVGPSGGGKTTVAALISRFWDVTEGSVSVGGTDVRALDRERLSDTVAYVFQDSVLLKRSIADNLRLAKPDATAEELARALHLAQCDDILAKLPQGMDTVIGTQGIYLSGGEQQRIAIARALLKDAPIVILDEATAFADPENEALVQRAFREIAKDKTVIMIAHRLSTVQNADCIYVLEEGSVVQQGTHAELLVCGGLYANLWKEYQRSVSWKVGERV